MNRTDMEAVQLIKKLAFLTLLPFALRSSMTSATLVKYPL